VPADDITRLRRAFEAWSRGDLDTALADVGPDFKLRDHVIIESTEEPSGPEAVRANHAQLLDGFDEFTLEPLEFVEFEDGILVRVLSRGHSSRQGGIDVELEVGQLWRLRDGIAVSLDIYPSWEEARRAAGLEDAG
jgi:ketosteroid isomerase-like protein